MSMPPKHERRGRRNGWGCLRPAGIAIGESYDEPYQYDHFSDRYIRIPFYGFLRIANDGMSWEREALDAHMSGSPSTDPLTVMEAGIIVSDSHRAVMWICEKSIQQADKLRANARRLKKAGDIQHADLLKAVAKIFEDGSEKLKRKLESGELD